MCVCFYTEQKFFNFHPFSGWMAGCSNNPDYRYTELKSQSWTYIFSPFMMTFIYNSESVPDFCGSLQVRFAFKTPFGTISYRAVDSCKNCLHEPSSVTQSFYLLSGKNRPLIHFSSSELRRQSQMEIFDSERKETGTKSVAMAIPQGVSLDVFHKLQLWCQVSIALPYYLQRYYWFCVLTLY